MNKLAITHSGLFHPDELTAIGIYEIATGETLDVLRTRDIDKFSLADLIFDIGEKYDKEKYFDHHQEIGIPRYRNGILYSTVGLILDNFLKDKNLIKYLLNNGLYAVQAIDNGQKFFNLKDRTKEKVTNLPNPFSFVRKLNATWEEGIFSDIQKKNFDNARKIVKDILINMVKHHKANEKAKEIISAAICDYSYLKLDYIIFDQYVPYEKEVIKFNNEIIKDLITKKGYTDGHFTEEEKRNIIKFCIFKNEQDEWNVFAIQKNIIPGDFDAWCSLDKDKCEKLLGFKFCHKFAFCAVFDNKESAIKAVTECRKDFVSVQTS